MKKLLIATWNPGKKKMYLEIIENYKNKDKIEFIFLDELENIEKPEENQKTVEDNALLKAKYYKEIFNLPTLWDDAWFWIVDLWWAPWVMARRWAWELPDSVSDDDWIKYFITKTSVIWKDRFDWFLNFSRCLYVDEENILYHNGKFDLLFTNKPSSHYRSWFPLDVFKITENWEYILDLSEKERLEIEYKRRCDNELYELFDKFLEI